MLIRGSLSIVCLCLLSFGTAHGQQYTITTFAGNGTAGYVDGSDLAAAQFKSPNTLMIHSNGAIYIADTGGHRIRLISGGSVSTVAGTGTAGYTGNNAAATSANINSPGGVTLDASGTVYIAETRNNVVRKISGGNISIYAGDKDGNAGNSGDGGPAANAQLYGPTGLAVDAAGNIYIADSANNLVRRVSKDGTITNYVGSNATSGRIVNPTGICVDASGALYIADTGHHRIVKYANGVLTTVAGNGVAGFSGDGGLAASAQLNNPFGVAVDAAGNVYIADTINSRIRKVTADGRIFTIAGGTGIGYTGDGDTATKASLQFPRGVAVTADGKVYIADTANNVIRMLTPLEANAAGVTNAASYARRVSPGALASIFGTNFGSITAQGEIGLVTNALPTSLGGIGVSVNGVMAPLLFVSPGQINFQVPWGTQTGTANVAVVINGGPSNSVQVPVDTAAPGLFVLPDGSAIVQNAADYTLNGPDHPAAPGSTITAYLTGSGSVAPAAADGTPTPRSPYTLIQPARSARIGSSDAQVSFAGLAPDFVGLVQFNIVAPVGLAPGTYPLTVTIDGQTSNAGNIVVK